MISDVKKAADQKMEKSVDALKADLAKIRTGRAHTGLLDHIHVDYYGTSMPLAQVANVTLADARTIGVQPWEKKMIPVVEKAIRDAAGDTEGVAERRTSSKRHPRGDRTGGSPTSPTGVPKADHVVNPDESAPDSMRAD